MSDYDGIILGSGHNSLILQAYLGRAGLRTVCLERRSIAGGGLETVEDPAHPGFLHNTHSFFHRGITAMPWYTDLRLAEYGARYVEPELNVAMVLSDGRVLEWWRDIEPTLESIAQFSRRDAATVARWHRTFEPILTNILGPEAQSPPVPYAERIAVLEGTREGRLLLDISKLSPLEFVNQEFESPTVQAGMLFFNGLREVDLRAKGFGHHIPALLASKTKAQMCLGGSARLARALETCVRASGGEIRVNAEPARIMTEGNRVVGVELRDGEVFRARKFVASGLNPWQTFVELWPEEALPAEWRRRAEAFKFNLIAPLFAVNVGLSEPPMYEAAQDNPHLSRALMVIAGLDHLSQYDDLVEHHVRGSLPPKIVMWGACPTIFDPSQAPPGRHTAFMWEKVPYRLASGMNWDAAKEGHADEVIELWSEYAPNLRDAVLHRIVRSPLDIERTFANMKYGDLLVGAFTNGQIGANRPFEGAGQYRGPLAGSYLCGSSSHPGGNITGLPGYNCAQVLLSDLGLTR